MIIALRPGGRGETVIDAFWFSERFVLSMLQESTARIVVFCSFELAKSMQQGMLFTVFCQLFPFLHFILN